MKSILLLEDSRTQAIIITKMFQKLGYEVVGVASAETAYQALAKESFFLLVLDVFIEGSNSLDELHVFRRLAPSVPIAVMTAGQVNNPEASADALNKARRARVDFLLPKPFYFDDLKQVCEDVELYWRKSDGSVQSEPLSGERRIA
ncbi:response regulator [Asticcacaulis sp. SL142]|jgi:DNA-binding NtrC family response regulator|uniref:response regulator n=1 Tax=Asticcacaulis sp. SL142 TaxID=2995155 RepID=UPI00226C8C0C|nr:response regulator [Asticcacaulis sp. SL142]WAC48832.1 response regulator [Asticcacaulis sp. SL142]